MKTYTNRLCFSLILVFGALVLLLGCSKEDKESSPAKTEQVAVQPGPATPPAAITGVNVSDPEVLARRKPIVVTFAQAMVAEEALNKDIAEKDMPFTISPAVAGKGRWLTDKSFAFAADENFAPGTEYSLYFNEDLKSLDKRPARWVLSFRTEAVNLRHVQTGSYDPQTFSLLLHFDFSALVDRRALAEHLGVSNAANNEALELDFSDSPEQGQSQIVTVRLGAHLPELDLAIRKDKPGDAHPLGLGSAYSMKITLPAPGEEGTARLSGAGDEPSPLTFYWPNVGEDDDGRLYARVDMSESLADGYQKEFISVSPNLPYTIDEYGSGLVFGQGLEPGMKVDVSLEPGLTDSAGRVLKERRAVSFNVPDYNGAVRFAEQGSFLTPLFGSRVAVNVINVDQVNVSLRRQYDNNLPFMALEPDDRAKNMMRDMAFKEIAIKGLTHNQAQRRAIDLEALAEGRRGVFMLTLDALAKKADPNTGESYLQYCGDAQRLVVLTDIGVSARVFPSGITVLATGISSAQPIGDAAVKVYSRSNQLIARGFTDADGVFVHQRERVWEDQLDPYIVTVQTGQDNEVDMTFLPLSYDTGLPQEDPALLYYLEYGCEAFVYTPRGVFRPGEQVDLKTFVRDENHQAPEPFPVLFKVISSRGVEVAANVATLSEEGGAACSFTLPASAPTGLYTANVEIPGNEGATLGSMSFSVEDFVPPRLEVNLKPEKEAIEAGQNLAADLSGRYLFGAPGAGLDYELGYRVWADQFEAEDFAGYSFGDAEKSFDSQINLEYMTGVLPESGEQRLDFVPPADWAEAPTVLQALLVAAVREDGGRWVNRTASLRYFPTPWLLGLKPDGENFSPGKELAVDVAAVSPEGQIVESGPLRAEISLIQGNWHTVYRNNRYVYTYDERFIPLHNAALPADSGRARLSYTPAQPGQYLVRVLSQDGAIAASCRVNVYGDAGQALAEGTGRMDQVELSLDKDEYRAGETARLAVKAPFAGTLLLGLEKGAQISTRVINMDAPGAVLDIPVTEGMDPNITITASVIRPVRGENREWHSHRAFGTTALVMSKKPHRLEVSLAAPEKALPLAPVSVPFTVTDEQGVPVEGEFSVALVDEGILSLTGFITPDPLDFFMGRRRATGYSYDAFDALLRPEAKATPLLKPGGGGPMAAAGAYQGSLGTQPVFLAAFAPVVKTDANGQGEVQFDVPEYSGKGRVMIVGASGGRFASGEAPVRFARDLVLEASAPRVAAPGDSFELSLNLFVAPDADGLPEGDVLIRLETEGPLTFEGDKEFRLPLADQSSQALTARLRAGAQPGLARVRLDVSIEGRDDLAFAKEVQVAVRPPYARTSVSTSALLRAGESATLTLPGLWSEGSLNRSFSLTASPAMGLLPALDFLRGYPYDCLEQQVSRAWPYLALPALRQALEEPAPDNDKGEGSDNNAAAMLTKYANSICALQRPGGGFAVWPDRGHPDPWRSIYALWFLNEVKDRVPLAGQALDAGSDYLRFVLAAPVDALGSEAQALSIKAFAAMVLTRNHEAPLGWMQHLAGQTDKMLPSGRIFLAGAMALKAGNAAALRTLLEQPKLLAHDGRDEVLNRTMESEARNKALLLWLWSQVEPGAQACRELCLDVLSLLGRQGWFSIQESGVAALAVGAWLEQAGIKAGPYNALVKKGDDLLAEVAEGADLFLSGIKLPSPDENGALAPLDVSLEGKGSAYAVYSASGVPLSPPEAVSNGLVISRVWKNTKGEVIDLSSGTARLERGDRVLVELTVRSERALNDIVLSDLLPGCLEVENARLSSPAVRGEDEEEGVSGLYVDQREDRMLLFFDDLKGEAHYSYSARAVSRGEFILPPLAADAMYDPQINAVTGTGRVIVE